VKAALLAARRPVLAPVTPPFTWTPADLGSTLLMWNEARDLSLSDGDPVGSWSGHGGKPAFTQATAGNKPTFRVVGGKAEVNFDGADDFMDCASALALKHVLALVKYNGASFATYSGIICGTLVNAAAFFLLGEVSTTKMYDSGVTATYHKDGVSFAQSNMQAPMNTYGVVSMSKVTALPDGPRLGLAPGGARNWNGGIRAIIGCDTQLSAGDRANAETYLGLLV
jgi:hypothetical protein